jgi:YHS domain-containing protein
MIARIIRFACLLCLVCASSFVFRPSPVVAGEAKDNLRPFQELIGSWRCTGEPFGSRGEKLKSFWQEKAEWQWQFKGEDAWLLVNFEKGKYFKSAQVHYLGKERYRVEAVTLAGETLTFEGKLEKKKLVVERHDDKSKSDSRLTINLLHSNRYVVRYEVKPPGQASFAVSYQIGCTKEGVAFADGDGKPECIVSGGTGTMAVSYKGKTYYVCCSGCRDAFLDEPEKYIREAEAAKKK